MDDRDIVAAVVAGDADGITYAYGKHAASLYGYCHWAVPEAADAAVALQDTFLIAAASLGTLRDPRRLRPWLYAVARRECHRWLRPADAVPPPAAMRSYLGPVRAALDGLDPVDREVIELNLGHHLAGSDLAAVLGVSRRQAHALVARARDRLEASLGTPLAARREELDQAMRPGAALPLTLRDKVLRLCIEGTPEALAYREWVTRRASQFGAGGFPRPVRRPRRMLATAGVVTAAGAAIALASTGIVAALTLSAAHVPGGLDAVQAGRGPATTGPASRSIPSPGGTISPRTTAATTVPPDSALPGGARATAGGPSASVTVSSLPPGWRPGTMPPTTAPPPPPVSTSASPTPASQPPSPTPDQQRPPSSPSVTGFP
jgi:DNA-directed RNA polymerase specialized sigma24 family protein